MYKANWRGSACAVKEIEFQGESESLFMKEIQVLFSMHHQNICRVFGACKSDKDQSFFILLEQLGSSLESKISKEALSQDKIVEYSIGIARGIQHLHENSPVIIHRDIKPSNILFNEKDIPVLIDFGIAKIEGSALTAHGVKGTKRWMAPERLQESPIVTPAADIFSFGLVLWQMFSRTIPFDQIVQDHNVSLLHPFFFFF